MARQTASRTASFPSLRPAGENLGAEVAGIDLSLPPDQQDFAFILQALHRYGVIFFRGQQLTPEQLAAFSRCFGELDIHHMTEHVFPHLPQVRVLSNVKKDGVSIGITRGGMHWHSDLSYKPQPALVTLLYGIECPPTGADTQFADMYAAFAGLPEARRRKLQALRAVHDRNFRYSALYPGRPPLTAEQVAKVPPVEHPLVRVHPATGRPALFVAKDVVSHIVGMPEAESRALIDELEAFATRPDRIYSHKWRPGDLVVWDNRCTLHRATPYDPQYRRTLYRTQVRGEAPIAMAS
ncbi:MAG: TauD/TfdA family dioxygenase [Burkholderiales bacterium]|jgi:taurine dioxygenase|nr:TauD/TfdA family dioxygenase [Burkholderiales bacterium]